MQSAASSTPSNLGAPASDAPAGLGTRFDFHPRTKVRRRSTDGRRTCTVSVSFHDYYSTLGVARDASADEIRRAYRKLARETHPDVDKTSGAKERFQRLNEAYEVLKDPNTRRRYDALGADWKEGQEFTPPRDFHFRGARAPRSTHGHSQRSNGFSSFFEALFGDDFPPDPSPFEPDASPFTAPSDAPTRADWTVTLQDLIRNAPCTVRLLDDAAGTPTERTLQITLPPGSTEGTTLRLRGQGQPTPYGPSDLWLTLHVAPHPTFRVEGHDLVTRVEVEPHVAVLGGEVHLRSPDDKELTLRIPRSTPNGQRLRLRGLGLARRDGSRGDLHVEVALQTPQNLTPQQLELYERLRQLRTNLS